MCTKQEVEDIAARAAKTAVEEVLKTLGIDLTIEILDESKR